MPSLQASCTPRPRFHGSAIRMAMQQAIPPIDVARLRSSPRARSLVVEQIGRACYEKGFFQVINHGICSSVTDGALCAAKGFFELPAEEKMELASEDVTRPVRYSTSSSQRFFLKHAAHPLKKWIHLWPSKPGEYREKMGTYALEVKKLALEVMEAIMESLGLNRSYLRSEMEEGLQVMAINGYPVSDRPDLVLGIPPHSDYSIITVVLQSNQGLEELDPEINVWNLVPEVHGSLLVHGGNYLEVISNGRYKSAVHRVAMRPERMRVSIASLHSLAMDERVVVAKELVDEGHPKQYRDSCFEDFLDFLANNNGLGEGSNYLDTLRIARDHQDEDA